MKLSIIIASTIIMGSSTAYAGQTPGSNFINNLDMDSNGEVTLAEATEHRENIFASFDSDDNGSLSSEEYDLFDEARASAHEGKGKGHGKHKKGGGMDRARTDLNGDGVVTQAEFFSQSEAWFMAKDRNGDGVVTSDDFGPRG